MSTIPPAGPGHPQEPIQPPGQPPGQPSGKPHSSPKVPSGAPSEDPSVLNSPFAKMFERSGAVPTAKQIHMMISTLLQQTLTEIKRNDERWKKAMQKLKKEIEGTD